MDNNKAEKKDPLVSVILTSYNHEKYLAEAIESALNQTFTNFKLIIVDDCSQDNSWEIIQRYKDDRIVAVRNPVNMRIKSLRNIVFNYTKGEYIAIHHSDDVWEPTKLEKQVTFLELHPEYAACFTQVDFIDENSEHYDLPDGHVYKGVFDKENRTKEAWLNHFFYKGNCLCHPSIMIRKEMYHKYGLLDTLGLAQIPDFLMWVKLCMYEEIYILQEHLTKFRLRKLKQANTSADKPENHIRGQFELYILLQEYKKIKNEKVFLGIFPECKKYFIDGNIIIEYALAKIAQENLHSGWRLLAINMLFFLINDEYKSKEIERLYGYTYKDFIIDTAKYDIFGVKYSQKYLYSSILFDTGNGFNGNECCSKEVYVARDGSFYAEYYVAIEKEIQGIRFDPTEGELLAIKIKSFKINGNECEIIYSNAEQSRNGYDIYFTFDPQYVINYLGQGTIKIIICGEIDLKTNILYEVIQERNEVIQERNEVIQERNEVIQERNEAIQERNEAIQERNEAIQERNEAIQERNEVKNLSIYKIVKRYYNIKSFFRK